MSMQLFKVTKQYYDEHPAFCMKRLTVAD